MRNFSQAHKLKSDVLFIPNFVMKNRRSRCSKCQIRIWKACTPFQSLFFTLLLLFSFMFSNFVFVIFVSVRVLMSATGTRQEIKKKYKKKKHEKKKKRKGKKQKRKNKTDKEKEKDAQKGNHRTPFTDARVHPQNHIRKESGTCMSSSKTFKYRRFFFFFCYLFQKFCATHSSQRQLIALEKRVEFNVDLKSVTDFLG